METTFCPLSSHKINMSTRFCWEPSKGNVRSRTQRSHMEQNQESKADIPTVVIACSQETALLKLMSQSFNWLYDISSTFQPEF